MTDDSAILARLLAEWSDWMRRDRSKLGYGRLASGGMVSGNSQDFDTMADNAELRRAEAMDACVRSLLPLERAAIERSQGITTIWPYASGAYSERLAAAHDALPRIIRRKSPEIWF